MSRIWPAASSSPPVILACSPRRPSGSVADGIVKGLPDARSTAYSSPAVLRFMSMLVVPVATTPTMVPAVSTVIEFWKSPLPGITAARSSTPKFTTWGTHQGWVASKVRWTLRGVETPPWTVVLTRATAPGVASPLRVTTNWVMEVCARVPWKVIA